MILRVFKILEFLRILRRDRERYDEFARGGALGDSDRPWPPIDQAPRGPSEIELHEHGDVVPPRPPMKPYASCPRCGSVHVWRYESRRVERSQPTALRCVKCSHVFALSPDDSTKLT